MTPSVAVLLVLVGFALSPPAHADSNDRNDRYEKNDRYRDGEDGRRRYSQRPDYLENNHGQLAPYGARELRREHRDGDSRRERYFRERRLRERWTFGPEGHQRDRFQAELHYRQRPYQDLDRRYDGHGLHRYERDDVGYRYYLRPFDARHRGRDDFGRFSIRVGDDREPGNVIFYNLPVSPRFPR